MRRVKVALITAPIVCLGIGIAPALSKNLCSPEPLAVQDPDLSKIPGSELFLAKLNTQFGAVKVREVAYDFFQSTYKGLDTIRSRELVALDFSAIAAGIQNDSYNKVSEQQNCNRVYHPEDFSLVPNPSGGLSGQFSIDFTYRACQIFDRPCVKDGYKITMCREEWKEDLFSHTFGVNISISRAFYSNQEKSLKLGEAIKQLQLENLIAPGQTIDEESELLSDRVAKLICDDKSIADRNTSGNYYDNVALCTKSEFDRRGFDIHKPGPNFLLNLIGVVTFNVGSKYILDNYRHSMRIAEEMINKAFANNLPNRELLAGNAGNYFLPGMLLNADQTRFQRNDSSSGSYLAFNNVSMQPEGRGNYRYSFCKSDLPIIKQFISLLRSTTIGDQVLNMDAGGSLWKISEKVYGSGNYFVSLLPANDIPFAGSDKVPLNSNIKVPAMYKIWAGDRRKVGIGDSLWRISEMETGSGKSYQSLFDLNSKYLDSPSKIYPLQLLRVQE